MSSCSRPTTRRWPASTGKNSARARTNARFGTCPTQRLWAVDGKQIATAGCGRQIVAPIDATGTPIGGGPCDNNAWSDVAAEGAVGGADETLGLALRDNRVYSVDRVGATYQIVEKTWPQTTEVKPAYEKATVIATVTDGTPRGAIVAGLFVYTSVRNGSQWDIRRYTLGKVDERVLLHTGIQDLALFTVVDDRVIFAVGTGSKGTQIFRGLPGGEGAGPPQLVGCGPVAPAQIAATNAFVFWTDLTPPMNGKPSLRGVAVDP